MPLFFKPMAIMLLLGWALENAWPSFAGFESAPATGATVSLHHSRAVSIVGTAFSGATETALQSEIRRQMVDKRGAVVVMDVSSGKLLAQWHLNIAAQKLDLPGSTVKPFVLLELLKKGRINPDQPLVCRRPLFIGGKRMDCSHPPGLSSFNASEALAYSCNSYFATVAKQLTAEELAGLYRRIGFESPTGHAENEAAGRINLATDSARLQLQALGEWGVEVSPLELLTAYQALAQRKLRGNLGVETPVFSGLERAVEYGVAHGGQPAGTTAAGKTGTASGLRTPLTHGYFVGYAPADKPEIVLLVYLERGRGMDAATVAGPMISAWWKNR